MKQICSMLVIFSISLTLFFSCGKDEVENNQGGNEMVSSSTFYQDTIFYYGAANTSTIAFEEQGETYSMEAFEGQVVVYFNDGISPQTAQKTITELGGVIIEQVPFIDYYLVDIGKGKEVEFISKIKNKNVEYASLNLVYVNRAYVNAYFSDNFSQRENGTTHGEQVASVYEGCAGKTCKRYDIGFKNDKGKIRIKGKDGINNITKKYPNDGLHNMSYGPILDENNEKLKWKDATEVQKKNYIKKQQKQIKDVVIRLKKMGKAGTTNTVVTIAAGNEAMSGFDAKILEPMLNGTAGENSLDSKEKEILKKNILIVTSQESSTNKSGKHNVMAEVDITGVVDKNGKQLSGSSFAAPKALCEIRNAMEETNITAVEAMQAVKEAVKNNAKGQIVRSEVIKYAKEIAKTSAQVDLINSPFNNTKWNVVESGTYSGAVTMSYGQGPVRTEITSTPYKSTYEMQIKDGKIIIPGADGASVSSVSGNNIKFEYYMKQTISGVKVECIYTIDGTLNSNKNQINGTSKLKCNEVAAENGVTVAINLNGSGSWQGTKK